MSLNSKRPAICRGRKTGTARTNGKCRPGRTTFNLDGVHALRSDVGRAWLALGGATMPSREAFVGRAIDELVQKLMAEDPRRSLPDSCKFIEPLNQINK